MKNILLFVFLLISIAGFAQQNEVFFSLQPFQDEYYDDGLALSYFRKVSANSALGVKTNIQWYNEVRKFDANNTSYFKKSGTTTSIDLVNRWNITKQEKCRLMIESGVSFKRQVNYEYHCYSCDSDSLITTGSNNLVYDQFYISNTSSEKTMEKTSLGFTFGLSLDFQVFKKFQLGLGYDLKKYLIHDFDNVNEANSFSFWYINLGYKF
ncbi:MAG: hypothetical protein ACI8VT_002452 [Saprospiraceae bacterium]|jgi:hypothetical protein